MKLVTVGEMRAIEAAADKGGVTYAMMMERAGIGLAQIVMDRYSDDTGRNILGLVGSGHNGGDTLIALEQLANAGWKVQAYLAKSRPGDPLISRLVNAGGEVLVASDDDKTARLIQAIKHAYILLDGLLGTGTQLPLRKDLAQLLAKVKKNIPEETQVIAVDCPSGVDCETGAAAPECIAADLTVCMAAVKIGLLALPAFSFIGELAVVDIGLPEDLEAWSQVRTYVVNQEEVYAILPPRPLDAHKGTFGTVMIIAGSVNYPGAAALSARAAYRIGAGLVRLAVPGSIYNPMVTAIPEAVFVLLPQELGVIAADAADVVGQFLADADALLLGPGFGLEDTTREFLEKMITGRSKRLSRGAIGFVASGDAKKQAGGTQLPPLIVDADGLKLLARIPDWWKLLPKGTIITPHPGEMSTLAGVPVSEIQSDRIAAARHWSAQWGTVIILKGAFTIVASPDGRASVIPVASPILATAGSGDVLAGAVAGLRAQGVDPYEAAYAGAWLHAKAGELAGWQAGIAAGILAGEIADLLPQLLPPDGSMR